MDKAFIVCTTQFLFCCIFMDALFNLRASITGALTTLVMPCCEIVSNFFRTNWDSPDEMVWAVPKSCLQLVFPMIRFSFVLIFFGCLHGQH